MNKIYTANHLKQRILQWRIKSDKIVFTNGCFDILHVGHIHTLNEAKKRGNKLIVAINTDASVKRLKGHNRPINNQDNRAQLIAAIQSVDAVVLFNDDTPLSLIQFLKPDVLVKGGDYSKDEIVGAKEVESWGGQVVCVPFLSGFSSTSIIEKCTELNKN